MALCFHAPIIASHVTDRNFEHRDRFLSLSSSIKGNNRVLKMVTCTNTCSSSIVTKIVKAQTDTIVRRSANYTPPAWKYDYIQSLSSNYKGDAYLKRVMKLKEDVKIMLDNVSDPLDGLELIDNLQRLGVFYHFEEEIKRILERIYNEKDDSWSIPKDLHAMALKFRLLRQHHYDVPQDVFRNFKDETWNFMAYVSENIKGLLSLYEATHFSFEGESILEEARDFTTKILKQSLKVRKDIDECLAILVSHALELPLHWRMPRLEAKWFIDVYKKRSDMNPTILQLAQMDFNKVQATHQEDLKHVSRWWKNTELGENLNFARDMEVENFLWTVGMDFNPQSSNLRKNLTIVNSLITTIDDVYDVYGTLDELELFTKAIERWDISALEQLPTYMKICFLALFNSINEMGYATLKKQGIIVIPYLQKAWADLCNSYLVEAKWYYNEYIPSFEEYMNNAWISCSAPVILAHINVICTRPTTKEDLESTEKYHNLIRWSSTILRLADDLGTSADEMKRGDVPKSVQCYMYESGASEKEAREYIKYLISETWKKMNEVRPTNSPSSKNFTRIAKNLARMAQCIYQYGDGHGSEDGKTKDQVLSLLIHPIPIM
ncbi:lysase [Sarracenia purpurea var. burkii]